MRGARRVVLVAASMLAMAALPAQAAAVTLAVSVQLAPGVTRACAGAARPCTVEALPGVAFELRAAPAADGAGRVVDVELLHRVPGSRVFTATGRRVALADAVVGRRFLLAQVDRRPGVTCLRATLHAPASPDGSAPPVEAASGFACTRFRPPIEIGWAGDTVVGSEYGLPPDGGRSLFDAVRSLLRAPDLMIGNYEGTFGSGGSRRCSGGALCYIFRSPVSRARTLPAAGFDVMNVANNHSLDYGSSGFAQTRSALSGVHLGVAGVPGQVLVEQVEDTRVAIVGVSPYPGMLSMRDLPALRSIVHAADRAGDVVVVTFHAGLEGAAGAHVPHGADYGTNLRAAVHAAVEAGADVVVGSGPHVVRGIERYRGTYIVYSSGNFAGWHTFSLGGLSSQSGVVRFTFDHTGRADGGTWDAVTIGAPGIPRPDRSGRITRRVAELSRADFGSAGVRFGRGGRFR